MIEKLVKEFKKIYNYNGKVQVFFSPGRVNLIGEHTDYNGGFVFPCALNFGTYGVAVKRTDRKCRMYSLNFESVGVKEFSLDNLVYEKSDNWVNYPKGVIKAFEDAGFKIDRGFDLLIFGTIPNGAGLSSSASLELLISVILKDFNNLDTDMINMIKLSQKAENQFIGVNCGIMDQFAIGMGKENNAILLDCNSLDYKYAPISLNGASVVIANTNKKRGLADSKYNERRASCETAVKVLNEHGVNIKYLGELSVDEFNKVKHFITDPEQLKRATHAVSENARTVEAVEKLKAGDIEGFGKLMNQSHISLNGASVVIANTNKKRGLADSKYNERRASCEAAVKVLNEHGVNIKYLGELSVDEFNKVKHFITDPEQLKRATHAVSENARTVEAVEKLKAGDIEGFGKLMNQSHISLRDDYEVTGPELDALVEAAWNAPGVIGSRMTGAGFGGCTVSIVKDKDIDEFIKEVGKKYTEKTGLVADFYVAKIGDGSRKLGEF